MAFELVSISIQMYTVPFHSKRQQLRRKDKNENKKMLENEKPDCNETLSKQTHDGRKKIMPSVENKLNHSTSVEKTRAQFLCDNEYEQLLNRKVFFLLCHNSPFAQFNSIAIVSID